MAAVYSSQAQTTGTTVGSLTASVTTPASLPFVIAAINQTTNSTNVSTVTFNGVTMTKLLGGQADSGGVTAHWLDVWYAAGPASTTANVVCTFVSGTTEGTMQVITASGVKASSPIGNTNTPATGASATTTGAVSLTTNVASSLIINFLSVDPFWSFNTPAATGTNQTQRGTSAATSHLAMVVSTQTTIAAQSYTDTWTWTVGSNTDAYISYLIEVLSNDITISAPFDSSAATESITMMFPPMVNPNSTPGWVPGVKLWTP